MSEGKKIWGKRKSVLDLLFCAFCLFLFTSHSSAQTSTAVDASEYSSLLSSAELAFEIGDYNRAVAEFALLHEQFPEDAVIGNNYAVALFQAGQHADAAALIQQFLSGHSEVGEITENLFTIYDYIASESYALLNGVEPEAPDLRLSDLSANISRTEPDLDENSAQNNSEQPAFSEVELRLQEAGVQETGLQEIELQEARLQGTRSEEPRPESTTVQLEETLSSTTAILNSDAELIEARLNSYIAAWADGDINRYFTFYYPNESPLVGVSYEEWRRNRADRIYPEREIELSLSELKVHFESGEDVVMEYLQIYRSSNYSDLTLKQIRWEKYQGVWYIRNERSLPR